MESAYSPYASPRRQVRGSPYAQHSQYTINPHDFERITQSMSQNIYPHPTSLYPPVQGSPAPAMGSPYSLRYASREPVYPPVDNNHVEQEQRFVEPPPAQMSMMPSLANLSNYIPMAFNLSSIYPKMTLTEPSNLKRQRTVREVELVQGNLVLDCPVPTSLAQTNARRDFEFSHMRYSAVTCDPDSFSNSQFTLRPKLQGRETELFICMTMYNVR